VAGAAFDPVTGPIVPSDPTKAVETTVQPPTPPISETTAPVTDTVQPTVDSADPAIDTVLQPVRGITLPVDEVQPLVEVPAHSITPPPDPSLLPGGVDTIETLARPIDADVAVSIPESSEPLLGGAWDDLVEAVLGLGPTEAQVIAGVTGVVAVGTVAIARGICSPTLSALFTNVRMLPCVAGATIQQSTAAVTSAVTQFGGHAGGRGPSRPVTGRDLPDGHVRDSFKSPSDGYRRFDVYDGSARLLAQIGAVLGAVYLAFLAIWVGLTRARWNGGLRPRG
jgi:hypothetical protein